MMETCQPQFLVQILTVFGVGWLRKINSGEFRALKLRFLVKTRGFQKLGFFIFLAMKYPFWAIKHFFSLLNSF